MSHRVGDTPLQGWRGERWPFLVALLSSGPKTIDLKCVPKNLRVGRRLKVLERLKVGATRRACPDKRPQPVRKHVMMQRMYLTIALRV